jgi:3-hydroxybutyryl-CoA dehydrogenase
MFNEYGEKKYKPSPLIWRLYRTKQLGARSGKGFYLYNDNNCLTGPNPYFQQ